MTRFNAWNVFKNGLIGQTGWDRQWRDPEPKKEYDVITIGAGLHGLATAFYLIISTLETPSFGLYINQYRRKL